MNMSYGYICVIFLFSLISRHKEVLACNTSACPGTIFPQVRHSLIQVTLAGVPRDLSDAERLAIQRNLSGLYECEDGNRNVTSIQFQPDRSVDLNSTARGTYSLVFGVDYTTNLCQEGFFLTEIDNTAPFGGSRALSGLGQKYADYTELELPPTRLRFRRDSEGPDHPESKRRLQDCLCEVPTPEDFLLQISIAIVRLFAYVNQYSETQMVSSIDDFIEIEEIEDIEGCDTTRRPWSGAAAWTVSQDLSMATPDFTNALGQAALETYNEFSAACDTNSRRVESVGVSIRSVVNANLDVGQRLASRARGLRWLEEDDNTTNATDAPSFSPTDSPTLSPTTFAADLFTIVFTIEGTCRNCASDLQLFDQVSGNRRKLDTSPGCGCGPGKEQRGQTAEEFLARLKLRLATIDILSSLASENGPFAEVRAIGCPNFNTFISFASVSFGTRVPEVTLSEAEKVTLSNGFVQTYNNLQATRCDRLFRFLDEADVIGTVSNTIASPLANVDDFSERWRYLQGENLNGTRGDEEATENPSFSPTTSPTISPTTFGADLFTVVFLTTGTCAGCPSETNLFDQISSRRELFDANSESLHMVFHRSLQSEGSCFCQLDDVDGTVVVDEFVDSLEDLVEDLNESEEFSLISVETLIQPTGAPSTLPSLSPSLSSEPSTFPSSVGRTNPPTQTSATQVPVEGPSPTSLPSSFPTNTASNENSSIFPVLPSIPPTLRPSEPPTSLVTTSNPTKAPSMRLTFSPTTQQTSDLISTIVPQTSAPTLPPTLLPTSEPTFAPTKRPTLTPTLAPLPGLTPVPSSPPSRKPTMSPTFAPTKAPTDKPTNVPTDPPTNQPTFEPTPQPSGVPTSIPTLAPTGIPTSEPTLVPTGVPTSEPTLVPTGVPTRSPTARPSLSPTLRPTARPTLRPTEKPTLSPTRTLVDDTCGCITACDQAKLEKGSQFESSESSLFIFDDSGTEVSDSECGVFNDEFESSIVQSTQVQTGVEVLDIRIDNCDAKLEEDEDGNLVARIFRAIYSDCSVRRCEGVGLSPPAGESRCASRYGTRLNVDTDRSFLKFQVVVVEILQVTVPFFECFYRDELSSDTLRAVRVGNIPAGSDEAAVNKGVEFNSCTSDALINPLQVTTVNYESDQLITVECEPRDQIQVYVGEACFIFNRVDDSRCRRIFCGDDGSVTFAPPKDLSPGGGLATIFYKTFKQEPIGACSRFLLTR